MQRTEIHWSPNDRNQLAEIGAEIIIHTFDRPLTGESGKCLLGGNSNKTTNLNYPLNEKNNIKCCSWWPSKQYPFVFAIGQPSGRIIFENVKDRSDPWSQERIVIDSKQGRPCLALSWNRKHPNLLLAGFDKYRADPCLFIWDINHSHCSSPSSSSFNQTLQNGNSSAEEFKRTDMLHQNQYNLKPTFECGSQELFHSLTWLKPHERLFAAAISQHSNRMIRIYDPKASNTAVMSFATRAPYNLCADSTERYLAASTDKTVYVYDTRSIERPLIIREEQEPIVRLSWNRVGSSQLGYSIRDSPKFHLLSVNQSSSNENESFVHRILQCPIQRYRIGLSSFDWNYFDEDRLVLLGGKEYFDYVIPSRSSINYSVHNGIIWTDGHKVSSSLFNQLPEDITSKVLLNYDSSKIDVDRRNFSANETSDKFDFDSMDVAPNTRFVLESFQRWSKNNNHQREGLPFTGIVDLFRDVQTTTNNGSTTTNLHTSGSPSTSIATQQNWSTSSSSTSKTVFDSPERQLTLQQCGWTNNAESKFNSNYDRLGSLIEQGLYEKAAAICIFQMNVNRAFDILNMAVQQADREDLATLIIALIGSIHSTNNQIDEKSAFNDYSTVIKSYQRPYLRAMFSFIFTPNGSDVQYQCVLDEEIDLNDKVAFAARYLNDQRLYDKLEKLSEETREKGDLQGILLTGLKQTGCELIQRYLDQTNDIRTAAFFGIHVPDEVCQDCLYVQEWIEGYRFLLDKLQMWNERAEFDIYRRHLSSSMDVHRQQIFDNSTNVKQPIHQHFCIFCQNCLDVTSINHQYSSSRVGARASQSAMINRSSSSHLASNSSVSSSSDLLNVCNNCRQNLPRCSICMMNLPSYIEDASNPFDVTTDKQILMSSQWFTWCRMCRHGGHAEHVSSWFLINDKCPVARCSCRCTLIDGIYSS